MNRLVSAKCDCRLPWNPASLSLALIACLACTVLPACHTSKSAIDETNPDARRLRSLVGNLVDDSADLATLAEKFAKKTPPSEALLAKVRRCSLSLVEPINAVGDVATFQVRVRQGPLERGVVEWTAVKEDGRWKLKTTPLP